MCATPAARALPAAGLDGAPWLLLRWLILLGRPWGAAASWQRLAPGPRCSLADESRGSRYFVWITDPHIDPYYGMHGQACQRVNAYETIQHRFGTMRCDPPIALLDSMVNAAAAVAHVVHADFLLFTGDFVRHRQFAMPDPYENVTSVVADVTRSLKWGFPASGILLGSLGNDDTPHNYELNITTDEPQNGWLANMASTFASEGVMPPAAEPTFAYGGFSEEQRGNLTFLTINTLIYAVKHVPMADPLPADPFGQLAWLRQRLEAASARRRPVWIVGHIPPGMETFGYTELWHPEYTRGYLEVVQDPVLGPWVAAQLFAHVHADEFRVLPSLLPGAGPVLLAGAVSPVYQSNPSFRLMEYDPQTGRPLGWSVYYSELPAGDDEPHWQLGYCSAEYEALAASVRARGSLQNAAFVEFSAQLVQGGPVWDAYATRYKSRYLSDLHFCGVDPLAGNYSALTRRACRDAYACAVRSWTAEQFEACSTRSSLAARNPDVGSPLVDGYYNVARAAHWYRLR
mmetsp:Transcript_42242/g.134147  ORF Transcript_42242/g.134147 Transcript_42242/m.134147 type:complete len:515 (-) Transcript_42242:87-1631(-)